MDIKPYRPPYIHKIILTGSANMYSTIIEQEKTIVLPKIKPLGRRVNIYGFFFANKVIQAISRRDVYAKFE